jgi:hypothetical protein
MDRLILSRLIVFLITFLFSANSYATDYPPPACVVYEDMTLTICPPDSIPGPPVQLVAYNIYVDDAFIDNISIYPPYETVVYTFSESQLAPGQTNFCVKAVYSDWISDPACDFDTVFYGFELPLYEDWSSGSFETNQWTVEGENWEINGDEGYPAPAAVFNGQPAQSNYSYVLASYYLRADTLNIEDIYVDYDIKLESANNTGTEFLRLEIWDWSEDRWVYWGSSANYASFDWSHKERPISLYVRGKVTRIRFHAFGNNSGNIQRWSIDNIRVTGVCKAPEELTVATLPNSQRRINYHGLTIGCGPWWLYWDDGTNYDAIGTGNAVEFEVAARWTPDQLTGYGGEQIMRVAFYPTEPSANYNIRVWKGAGIPELVLDQPAPYINVGEWNSIYLDSMVTIDESQELWVGYKIVTPTGYPAGCDDGPAIDGYGNMINFGGWQTLLQVNPYLDYNWNISVYTEFAIPNFDKVYVYRQMNFSGEYERYDSTLSLTQYTDYFANPGDHYCYKLTALYSDGTDTCESPFSNEACDSIFTSTAEPSFYSSDLSIYPNPASDFIKITGSKSLEEILIYNSLGELVSHSGYGGSETIISIANLPNGLYFIRIRIHDSEVTKKLVVLH